MATSSFARNSLVLLLACLAATSALDEKSTNQGNRGSVSVQTLLGAQRSAHNVAKRSVAIPRDGTQSSSAAMTALKETGKLVQMTAMLPAEALNVVRLVAVPLLNTTIAIPENILEGAATMSLTRSLKAAHEHHLLKKLKLLNYLAPWKYLPLPRISLHKNISFGPISLRKVVEIGAPIPVTATPAPEAIGVETTPLPPVLEVPTTEVIPIGAPATEVSPTEAPAPVVDVAAVTPAPSAVVVVTNPPPAGIPETTTPVSVPEPATPASVPESATPASVPESATPTPVTDVVPAVPAVLPVVVPPPPKKECTNQVAIVQNSPPALTVLEIEA